jgi:hypothetical protein
VSLNQQRKVKGEIGKFFGGINSSGVSQHTRSFDKILKKDAMLSEKVQRQKNLKPMVLP